jgi:hypothetical protein
MSPLIPSSEVGITLVTLAISAGVILVFAYVGYRLLRRPVSGRSQLAAHEFALWWIGLGVAIAAGRLELALALANSLPYALALTFSLVNVILESVYLWGLVGSLVYLYTGRYYMLALGILYSTFYVVSVFAIFSQGPYAVSVASGTPTLVYASPADANLALALTLVVLVPEFVAACMYLSLLRHSRDRSVQWRISLVGASILFWVGVHAFVPSSSYELILAKTILDGVAAVVSLIGIFPPAWIRRKLGIALTAESDEYHQAEAVAVGAEA